MNVTLQGSRTSYGAKMARGMGFQAPTSGGGGDGFFSSFLDFFGSAAEAVPDFLPIIQQSFQERQQKQPQKQPAKTQQPATAQQTPAQILQPAAEESNAPL